MDQNTSTVSEPDQNRPKKQDAATRWRKLLEDQRVSGLPISVFCRERGVPVSSLFAWRRRLTRGNGNGNNRGNGAGVFKPVELAGEPTSHPPRADGDHDNDDDARANRVDADGGIELCLIGRRPWRLVVRRGFDQQLLLDLLQALEARPAWSVESRS